MPGGAVRAAGCAASAARAEPMASPVPPELASNAVPATTAPPSPAPAPTKRPMFAPPRFDNALAAGLACWAAKAAGSTTSAHGTGPDARRANCGAASPTAVAVRSARARDGGALRSCAAFPASAGCCTAVDAARERVPPSCAARATAPPSCTTSQAAGMTRSVERAPPVLAAPRAAAPPTRAPSPAAPGSAASVFMALRPISLFRGLLWEPSGAGAGSWPPVGICATRPADACAFRMAS